MRRFRERGGLFFSPLQIEEELLINLPPFDLCRQRYRDLRPLFPLPALNVNVSPPDQWEVISALDGSVPCPIGAGESARSLPPPIGGVPLLARRGKKATVIDPAAG